MLNHRGKKKNSRGKKNNKPDDKDSMSRTLKDAILPYLP